MDNKDIDEQITETDETIKREEAVAVDNDPVYKMFEGSKIPVSKHAGKLWNSRRKSAQHALDQSGVYTAWDEAVRYYKNDQTNKKDRTDADNPEVGNEAQLANSSYNQTENIVFANVSALVPAIYAKNPDVTIKNNKEGDEHDAVEQSMQKLIQVLLQKRSFPGINLKPKARRAVVTTTLTNISFIEVGYTKREQSSDAVLAEVVKVAGELEKATDLATIKEVEGKLNALTEKVDLLQPSGPWAKFRRPKEVVLDPEGELTDLTDHKWLMLEEMISTSLINAVYRKKDEDGKLSNIYSATHVMAAKSQADDTDDAAFTIFNSEGAESHKDFGYDDEDTFKMAQRTKCFYVWDKSTRRVMLFADNDWSFPLWVWDDPYGLDEFFPVYPLAFHTDPEDFYARGEVSYYLDQQDAINLINSQVNRMRFRVANSMLYDKGAFKSEADVQAMFTPNKGTTLIGVKTPEGKKLSEMVSSVPIPQINFPQLFDKASTFDSVNRVSGVPSVVQGVEYKTNTTNKAIDSYESSSQTRLDEKIDSIEELIGRIGNSVLVMCLQFMSQDEVAKLVGPTDAKNWPKPMKAREAQEMFSLTVTGGSSLKPTSAVRKNQAMQLAQTLGQFASATPAVLIVALKAVSRAFSDEIDITGAEWDMLNQAISQQMQAQQQPPQQQGGQPQQQGAQQQGGAADALVEQLTAAFAKMPPDILEQVGAAIGNGTPLNEVLAQLTQQQ